MSKTVRILGMVKLNKSTVFVPGHEYAGMCTRIEVPSGEYPIELNRDQYGKPYIVISMPGMQIFSSFYNRIGSYGSNRVDNTPTPSTYHMYQDAYIIAEAILNKQGKPYATVDYSFSLAGDIEARRIDFEYNGEMKHTHGLFDKATGNQVTEY